MVAGGGGGATGRFLVTSTPTIFPNWFCVFFHEVDIDAWLDDRWAHVWWVASLFSCVARGVVWLSFQPTTGANFAHTGLQLIGMPGQP